VKVLLLI